ncbi:energy transducer TonB [Kordia sp.]|uniref:energy transducer TonB n=1 Tax=Kordia sp. TaxID=1965332 RepID=UPI003D6BACFA
MKKVFFTALVCVTTFICKAQDGELIYTQQSMATPDSEYAEGCEDAESRYKCSNEKLLNAAFEALSTSDIEKVMQHTKQDIIFMDTKLFFRDRNLDTEKSFLKFHETELKFFEIDLSFSLEDLPFKPSPKLTRNKSIFNDYLYLKIDRDNKKLIPLPNYEPKRIPFSGPEKYIVYPGCESKTTNKDLKKCMSTNISKHVGENFNAELATTLNLRGVQKIYVVFTISKDGNVTKTRVRAPHQKLTEEAKRVIKLLPNMKPGEIENTPIDINYTLPIVFKVR